MPVSLPGVFLGLFVLTEYPLEELTHIIPIFLAAAQMQQVLFTDLSLSKDQKTIGFIPKPTEKQKKKRAEKPVFCHTILRLMMMRLGVIELH